ncbi:MAG TPA: methyltransferase domain-containing protein [Thermoanaerobaculia bacterium]
MTAPRFACPACGGALAERSDALVCASCGRSYPILFGIPDLRLTGDRYLSLEEDRRRAQELFDAAAKGRSFEELLAFYWEKTESTPPAIAARHIAGVRRSVDESRPMIEALPGERFLDVGSGAGGSLVAALRSGRFTDLFGIDSALRWLVIAQHRLKEMGRAGAVRLAAASADALPFSGGGFDSVFLRHLLEHVADPARAIESAARVLAPGGSLGVEVFQRWTPAPEPHVGLWGVAWLPRKAQRAYVRWRTGDDYSAIRLPSRREIFRALSQSGLELRSFLFSPLSPGQRASVSPRFGPLFAIYALLAGRRLGRGLLSRFGPLLRFTAIKSRTGETIPS